MRIHPIPYAFAVLASLSLVAACNGDDAGEADEEGDDTAAAEEAAEDTEGEEPGDGDPEASTATFRGDELDFHQVECQEQFDRDGVEIRARADDPQRADDDPWEDLVLEVNETEDGAFVTLRRAHPLDGQEWDFHEWRAPSAEREGVEAGVDGARGEVELELTPGADEDVEETDHSVTFDIAC